MENSFQDMLLFDFATGHFVKKNDLSDMAKEKYQEHAIAHVRMMHEPRIYMRTLKNKK